MNLKIKPLTGQILVQVLPPDDRTDGGLIIPDIAQGDTPGEKQQPFRARVLAMGPWKKTKQGYGVLPDFGIGATVLCTPYAGTKLSRNIGERYQLVRFEDVLAQVDFPTAAG